MTRTRTIVRNTGITVACVGSAFGLLYMAAGTLPPTTAYSTPAVSAPAVTEPAVTEPAADGRPSTDDDGLWPPVDTFEQAIAQCTELSTSDDMVSDCIDSAIGAWCMFVPFQPGDPHYDPEFDGRCLEQQQDLPDSALVEPQAGLTDAERAAEDAAQADAMAQEQEQIDKDMAELTCQ